jgi:hypothetical protein
LTHTNNYIHFIHYLLLIIALIFGSNSYSQESGSEELGLDYPVYYSATDSIVADIPNQIVRLYGEANVTYDDLILDAEIIEIDLNKNEVSAYYGIDSTGIPIGKPVFTQSGEEIKCESIKYNFNTKQGYITEVRTQQGEGYIHMAESKIQPNKEIHFKNGKYTTCDAEKPHYHFQLSKAMVIPEKRIVTGPVYMKILNIPLPIAAPFAFLPNSESRKHGIIIPEFALAGQYGSGLRDLGYYIPINQNWETFIYGTLFTTGNWGLRNETNYYKRYKYRGNFSIGYQRLSGYFYQEINNDNYTVRWKHNQEATAHPSVKFNSDINFISNNPQNSLEGITEDYFNTQLNSSMNLTKSWKANQFNGSWTLKTALRQNKLAETYNFDLPSFNLNVSRFDLGVLRKSNIGKKWYENIFMTYTLNSANTINAPDSIFNANDYNQIGDYALNGIKQNAILTSNLKPKSGWFNFTLQANYNELWNFQSYEKDWNTITDTVDVTLQNGLNTTRNVNFSGGLSTNLYGYYKSPKQNVKARHVMSPNISFTYQPDLGAHQFYVDSSLNSQYYSPFDVSLYKEVARGESGEIKFSLGNTFELKSRNKKDSLSQTYKSKRLIDALSVGGSYDIFKDSMQLSDFTFSFRTTPVKNIGLQAGWRLSPYAWDDVTGKLQNGYAWDQNKGIGRITRANTAISARFKSKAPIKSQPDSTGTRLNIPWVMNFSYNIDYSRNQTGIVKQDTFKLTQTIRWDGNISFNDKWKFDYKLSYNLQNFDKISPMKGLTQWNFTLWRDLHCWEAALDWRQTGYGVWGQNSDNKLSWDRPNYVLSLKVNIKASMFNAFLPEQRVQVPVDLWK